MVINVKQIFLVHIISVNINHMNVINLLKKCCVLFANNQIQIYFYYDKIFYNHHFVVCSQFHIRFIHNGLFFEINLLKMQYIFGPKDFFHHISPYAVPTPLFQPSVTLTQPNSGILKYIFFLGFVAEGNFPYKKGDTVYFIQPQTGYSAVTCTTFIPLTKVNDNSNPDFSVINALEDNISIENEQKVKTSKENYKFCESSPDKHPVQVRDISTNPAELPKLKLPKCSRCHIEFVNIKNGRRMKTCKDCLLRSKYNQRRSLRLKEFFSNSKICSTCNRNVAMVKGRKQYRTCEACIQKKKVLYENQRQETKMKQVSNRDGENKLRGVQRV